MSENRTAIYVPMPLNSSGDGPADPNETVRVEHQVWDAETNLTMFTAQDETTALAVVKAWNRRTPAPEGEDWTEDAELERRQADYERGFRDGRAASPVEIERLRGAAKEGLICAEADVEARRGELEEWVEYEPDDAYLAVLIARRDLIRAALTGEDND